MIRPGTLWSPGLALKTLIETTSLAHLVSMTPTLPHFSQYSKASKLYWINELESNKI